MVCRVSLGDMVQFAMTRSEDKEIELKDIK
jgi:hypothetical protein